MLRNIKLHTMIKYIYAACLRTQQKYLNAQKQISVFTPVTLDTNSKFRTGYLVRVPTPELVPKPSSAHQLAQSGLAPAKHGPTMCLTAFHIPKLALPF